MSEKSIFHKEEEILNTSTDFLALLKDDFFQKCLSPNTDQCPDFDTFYKAFKNLQKGYKKLYRQTNSLVRLSDWQQHKINQSNKALKESQKQLERRNTFIRNTFGRYMSNDVVENILDHPEGLRLGGELKTVTTLMSDLRGFTSICERFEPEDVVRFLNMYLQVMTEIIHRYQGTILEILGDGVLVVFGAPITREDDAPRAVACALEMQQSMQQLNLKNQALGFPVLGMGTGIHTGTVIAGNIGSEQRSKYSLIGTNVNLTARIESYTVAGQILVSQNTLETCSDLLRIDDQMQITPKGITHALTIYDIGGIGEPFNIQLPNKVEPLFFKLLSPLEVQFQFVKEKHTQGNSEKGIVTHVSEHGCQMDVTVKLKRFDNLKMSLFWKNREITTELFAKVTKESNPKTNQCHLVFTNLPPEAKSLFHKQLTPTN